jgi:hypothetical protein
MNVPDADREAIGIYAVMARDPMDALDMINECKDVQVLETLHAMLVLKGNPNTDEELNDIMEGPTKRRLDKLKGISDG